MAGDICEGFHCRYQSNGFTTLGDSSVEAYISQVNDQYSKLPRWGIAELAKKYDLLNILKRAKTGKK